MCAIKKNQPTTTPTHDTESIYDNEKGQKHIDDSIRVPGAGWRKEEEKKEINWKVGSTGSRSIYTATSI